MGIDLNVQIGRGNIDEFVAMAERLGLEYIIATMTHWDKETTSKKGVQILPRTNLTGKTLNALRTQINQTRRKAIIVSVPLKEINIVNWAAEDSRIDVLTLISRDRKYGLKPTTAKLAADSDIALELPIRPIMVSFGFERSKILKIYREATVTALEAGMQVVLSSGAQAPIEMRSPAAIRYIGEVVGLGKEYLSDAEKWGYERIQRNIERIDRDFIAPGIRIVKHEGVDS
ncbi:MAG: RNase P subunit p30 family protein [Candidatus Thorarchaeota archaeon]